MTYLKALEEFQIAPGINEKDKEKKSDKNQITNGLLSLKELELYQNIRELQKDSEQRNDC